MPLAFVVLSTDTLHEPPTAQQPFWVHIDKFNFLLEMPNYTFFVSCQRKQVLWQFSFILLLSFKRLELNTFDDNYNAAPWAHGKYKVKARIWHFPRSPLTKGAPVHSCKRTWDCYVSVYITSYLSCAESCVEVLVGYMFFMRENGYPPCFMLDHK